MPLFRLWHDSLSYHITLQPLVRDPPAPQHNSSISLNPMTYSLVSCHPLSPSTLSLFHSLLLFSSSFLLSLSSLGSELQLSSAHLLIQPCQTESLNWFVREAPHKAEAGGAAGGVSHSLP